MADVVAASGSGQSGVASRPTRAEATPGPSATESMRAEAASGPAATATGAAEATPGPSATAVAKARSAAADPAASSLPASLGDDARPAVADRVICCLPALACAAALLEYLYLPNLPGTTTTYTYVWFLGGLGALALAGLVASLASQRAYRFLRYHAPFYTLVFGLLLAYDVLTVKTGRLPLPYFPWVDQVLNAGLGDAAYLADCAANSLKLLFTGYGIGLVLGLVTGVACGYSRRANYWVEPFMKLVGTIPSTTWIPVVMVLAATLFDGAVFIIALGVWYAVTLATITGIKNIDRAYYEAARTLGARTRQLVFRIAIPSALPSILQGMTQAMSSACTALLVAEMIGVESGLGWYITWQRSWAQYGKMYAAIVLICLIFVAVYLVLNLVRRRVLRWQEGRVR